MQAKLIAIVCGAVLSGCAAPPDAPPDASTTADPQAMLADVEAHVVTARDAAVGRGPMGINHRFTLDGKMVAYVVLTWPQTHEAWGKQSFESRWYHEDQLVVKRETEMVITRSPFQFWSNVYPVALGPGKGRYEVYANGRKLAEAAFEVLPAAGTVPPAPLGRQTDLSAGLGPGLKPAAPAAAPQRPA